MVDSISKFGYLIVHPTFYEYSMIQAKMSVIISVFLTI